VFELSGSGTTVGTEGDIPDAATSLMTIYRRSSKQEIIIIIITIMTASVVQWSEFLATDPEARVRFPALPEKKIMGLERGPLSLVSTTEELLDRKVADPV
jgi:hypothetical protein